MSLCCTFASWSRYVHSFLGLGATEAQKSLQRYLADRGHGIISSYSPRQVQAREVTDPCLLLDYSVSRPVGPGGEQVLLQGGGDAEGCKAAIRRSLVNTEAPCPLTPCSFDGVYQPDLTEGGLVLKKSFYQISAFFYTAEFFGLPETARLEQLEDAGREFCRLDWLAAQMAHPNTPPQFLANYCFSSMYLLRIHLCNAYVDICTNILPTKMLHVYSTEQVLHCASAPWLRDRQNAHSTALGGRDQRYHRRAMHAA